MSACNVRSGTHWQDQHTHLGDPFCTRMCEVFLYWFSVHLHPVYQTLEKKCAAMHSGHLSRGLSQLMQSHEVSERNGIGARHLS